LEPLETDLADMAVHNILGTRKNLVSLPTVIMPCCGGVGNITAFVAQIIATR